MLDVIWSVIVHVGCALLAPLPAGVATLPVFLLVGLSVDRVLTALAKRWPSIKPFYVPESQERILHPVYKSISTLLTASYIVYGAAEVIFCHFIMKWLSVPMTWIMVALMAVTEYFHIMSRIRMRAAQGARRAEQERLIFTLIGIVMSGTFILHLTIN